MIDEKQWLEKESSSLVYINCNFNKFNIGDEEFDQLSEDTIYKHLNKFFYQRKWIQGVKTK